MSESIKTLDLDEAERIGKAAFPGEWENKGGYVGTPTSAEFIRRLNENDLPFTSRRICSTANDAYLTPEHVEANGIFIAYAHNNWQAMVDEIRRLQRMTCPTLEKYGRTCE